MTLSRSATETAWPGRRVQPSRGLRRHRATQRCRRGGVSCQLVVALLVFLAAAAGAWIVAPHTRHSLCEAVPIGHTLRTPGLGRRRVGDVGQVAGLGLHLLSRLVDLLRRLHPDIHENTGDIIAHAVEQLPEKREGLALV